MLKIVALTMAALASASAGEWNEVSADIYGQSLRDCRRFAAHFENTCRGKFPSTDFMGDSANWKSGALADAGCNHHDHKRALCVRCEQKRKSGKVYIVYEGNGIPAHCPEWNGKGTPIEPRYMGFKVRWNAISSSDNVNFRDNQDGIDGVLCGTPSQQLANVPAYVKYEEAPGTNKMAAVAGFGLHGEIYESPPDAQALDPFFPNPWYAKKNRGSWENQRITVDECGGHTNDAGQYHHHAMNWCGFGNVIDDPSPWTGALDTSRNGEMDFGFISTDGRTFTQMMYQGFPGSNGMTPIGLVRDGHILYGPVGADGKYVYNGVDVCNGIGYSNGGTKSYVYHASLNYPYTAGCWGPAGYASNPPSCTCNGRTYSADGFGRDAPNAIEKGTYMPLTRSYNSKYCNADGSTTYNVFD